MKTLAGIIHARKTSTRCPNKHLRDLSGTTLIDIALEKLSKLDVDEKYLAVITKNGLWIKDIIDKKIYIINSSKIDNQFLIDNFYWDNYIY